MSVHLGTQVADEFSTTDSALLHGTAAGGVWPVRTRTHAHTQQILDKQKREELVSATFMM